MFPKMSEPSIQVIGISTDEDVFENTQPKSTRRIQLRVHGRVVVFQQDGAFDTVRIRLQGVVRTKVGSQVAIEKVSRFEERRGSRR